jgi:hypothetical protein
MATDRPVLLFPTFLAALQHSVRSQIRFSAPASRPATCCHGWRTTFTGEFQGKDKAEVRQKVICPDLDVEIGPVHREALWAGEVVRFADICKELQWIARKKARDMAEKGFEINVRRRLQEAVDGEKNRVVAAANGVALLGAVSIINGCPEWLPELFRLPEAAHGRVPKYTKAIEAQFGDFWKVIGARQFESIEEFRYSMSRCYFSQE